MLLNIVYDYICGTNKKGNMDYIYGGVLRKARLGRRVFRLTMTIGSAVGTTPPNDDY